MLKRKNVRQQGKISLSNYFQSFNVGERITVIRELSLHPKFPKTLQGRSGIVNGKRGKSYIVTINDVHKEKTYIIHPVHLRRLQ